jgi:hypothetical protein
MFDCGQQTLCFSDFVGPQFRFPLALQLAFEFCGDVNVSLLPLWPGMSAGKLAQSL